MSLEELIKKYNIKLLLTFGSFGTDRFTKDSDIDVAYESYTTLADQEEIQLLEDLMRYFKRDRIDLVNLAKAIPLLMYEIACSSILLYEKDNSYLNFKMRASARYADTKFLRTARKDWLNEQVRLIESIEGGI